MKLAAHADGDTTITIGSAAYVDHGMGFEAGIYAAYFANTKIVADLETPGTIPSETIIADLVRVNPASVMVWGMRQDPSCVRLARDMQLHGFSKFLPIVDAKDGQVGTIFFLR